MTDFWFPRSIKPLINKAYSTSRGSNVKRIDVDGGLPRLGLKTTLESPEFTLNFIMSKLQYQAFLSFYDGAINHGASSFRMMLDSGTGIVQHQCYILPNSIKVSKPSDGSWVVSMNMLAEVTPNQLDSCSNLYELYDCYGGETCNLILALEDFVVSSVYA